MYVESRFESPLFLAPKWRTIGERSVDLYPNRTKHPFVLNALKPSIRSFVFPWRSFGSPTAASDQCKSFASRSLRVADFHRSDTSSAAKSASTATFVTALVFNAAVFGIELVIFTLLRPYFKAIYEPLTYTPPQSCVPSFFLFFSLSNFFQLVNAHNPYPTASSHGLLPSSKRTTVVLFAQMVSMHISLSASCAWWSKSCYPSGLFHGLSSSPLLRSRAKFQERIALINLALETWRIIYNLDMPLTWFWFISSLVRPVSYHSKSAEHLFSLDLL